MLLKCLYLAFDVKKTVFLKRRSAINVQAPPSVHTFVGVKCKFRRRSVVARCSPGGGGVLPFMGYMGMCGAKGYGFSAALVINRVLILAILVINRLSTFAL